MRILLDFKCDVCGDIIEKLVHHDVTEIPCLCGSVMTKQLSAPRSKLEGITGHFPGAWHKWASDREKRAAKKKRE